MAGMSRGRVLVLVVGWAALAGCGGADSVETARRDRPARGGDAGLRAVQSNAEPKPVQTERAPPSDTPEAAVLGVLAGLRNNRPGVLWESLPASYRRDVSDLVHEFAGRIDRDVWNRGFGTASRLIDVLRAKKDLAIPWLAQLPPVRAAGPTNERDLSAAYDQVLGLLSALVENEAADLDRLSALDVGRFVDQTGGDLMERLSEWSRLSPDDPFQNEFKQWLAEVKVEPVSRQGDTATLRITARDALGEPIEHEWEFVRIEGKWIPKAWADDWDRRIVEIRGGLERFTSQTVAEHKPAILARLDQIDAVLEEVRQAGAPGEFQLLISEKVVAPLLLAYRSAQTRPAAAPPASGSGRAVVIVRGTLGPATLDELQLRLSEAGDAVVGVPRAEEDGVRFEVAPVRDVTEYARKLDFLRVLHVDPARRTITAEPAIGP